MRRLLCWLGMHRRGLTCSRCVAWLAWSSSWTKAWKEMGWRAQLDLIADGLGYRGGGW